MQGQCYWRWMNERMNEWKLSIVIFSRSHMETPCFVYTKPRLPESLLAKCIKFIVFINSRFLHLGKAALRLIHFLFHQQQKQGHFWARTQPIRFLFSNVSFSQVHSLLWITLFQQYDFSPDIFKSNAVSTSTPLCMFNIMIVNLI